MNSTPTRALIRSSEFRRPSAEISVSDERSEERRGAQPRPKGSRSPPAGGWGANENVYNERSSHDGSPIEALSQP